MAAGRLDELFEALWQGYLRRTPVARRVHELLAERGETVVNDHIALRTFDRAPVEIEVLDRELVEGGYQPVDDYRFEAKKLIAYHYEHPQPNMPKVFISALCVDELPADSGRIIDELLDQIEPGAAARPLFAASGRHWSIDHSTYLRLRKDSEYAAWLAAFGFCANHFTVSFNHLRSFSGLSELNRFLQDAGIELDSTGGLIKGSPEQLLEQSSTRAEPTEVTMADGTFEIPSCYYEFARRYPDGDGKLFQGFVPSSANHLFESTDPLPISPLR